MQTIMTIYFYSGATHAHWQWWTGAIPEPLQAGSLATEFSGHGWSQKEIDSWLMNHTGKYHKRIQGGV
mgnify:CR=1 FL=1